MFPDHKYAFRKGLGTCDAMLDIVCVGQAALDRGRELAVLQIDFSWSHKKLRFFTSCVMWKLVVLFLMLLLVS